MNSLMLILIQIQRQRLFGMPKSKTELIILRIFGPNLRYNVIRILLFFIFFELKSYSRIFFFLNTVLKIVAQYIIFRYWAEKT